MIRCGQYAEDGDLVSFDGTRLKGRQEPIIRAVEAAMAELLEEARPSSAHFR